jgi:hypothetical protein
VLVTDAAPAEGGYGLLLVEELADRWGVVEEPVPSKTVWAELDLVKRDASLNVALAADSASAGTRL